MHRKKNMQFNDATKRGARKRMQKRQKKDSSGGGTRKRRPRWTKGDTELALLALPTTVWYALFSFLPMFGLLLAFKNYKIAPGHGFVYGLIHSDWSGFSNFTYFLKSNAFAIVLRNTILYNIVFIVLNIVLPVLLAILISQLYSKKLSKTYQTIMFFPHFMSWVVVSYFVYAFLSYDKGLMNSILTSLGKDPINWYSTAKYWPFILVFMQTWKSIGYNMVVYLASITGIDSSLYEAAMLDGASKVQQAKYITIPSIKPIIVMMFILSVGRIFSSDFGLFYQIPRGTTNSLYNAVTTFDVYIYNALQTPGVPLGRTAAASFFQAIACCITILIANWIVKKIDRENAIL